VEEVVPPTLTCINRALSGMGETEGVGAEEVEGRGLEVGGEEGRVVGE